MTDPTADEKPTDWTRTTRNLLLQRIAEDIRPEISDWLGVYRADVRTAAFREAADLIEAKAAAALDAIPEDEQDPSDQDRYQEWLAAGDVLRAAVKANVAPAETEPVPATALRVSPQVADAAAWLEEHGWVVAAGMLRTVYTAPDPA